MLALVLVLVVTGGGARVEVGGSSSTIVPGITCVTVRRARASTVSTDVIG